MEQTLCEQSMALAKRLLHSYYCDGNVEDVVSVLAPDVLWVGAGEGQVMDNADDVAAFVRAGAGDLEPCEILRESYAARMIGDSVCVCQTTGTVRALSGIRAGFCANHRVSFVFERRGGELKLCNFHYSLAYAAIERDELFPTTRRESGELNKAAALRDRQLSLMMSQLSGGMMICHIDSAYNVKWISDSLCELLGYISQADFYEKTGGDPRGFVHEQDYENMCRRLELAVRTGEQYYVEYRVVSVDGSVMWMSERGRLIQDTDGENVIYSFNTNITETKTRQLANEQADLDAKRRAAFLTQLYDTVPCGIVQFTTDESHSVVSINRMTWEFYGFDSRQAYFDAIKSPFMLVLDEDREWITGKINSLTLDGENVSYTRKCVLLDGSVAWINVAMGRIINSDGIEVIQAVFTDITQIQQLRMARERDRLIENSSLRAAIHTAYPLIMNINFTSGTYDCFMQDGEFHGIPSRGGYDELIVDTTRRIHQSYRSIFCDTFSRPEVCRRFEGGAREIYLEFVIVSRSGGEHWLSVHLIYVQNPVSDDTLAIALVKVLDEQRAQQARQDQILRDALTSANAANNAKSEFLSRMSHDIRTPMNAIIGMSAIGRVKAHDPEAVLNCFEKIDTSSHYLLSLINDILDMTKIESGKMAITRSPFDIMEMLSEIRTIVQPQAREHGIRFEIRINEPIRKNYIGDALRVKQVLLNLLSNALKFTPRDGRIGVDVCERRVTGNIAHICFTVRDTGIGMTKQFMSRMFQPFEQEQRGSEYNSSGSGLGLSIVYNLAQLMGGTMSAVSHVGSGTTFTVELPFEQTQSDDTYEAAKNIRRRSVIEGLEILVADDDADVGEQVRAILEDVGAYVDYVPSGQEAISRTRAKLASGDCYDIAMIDLRMPDIDGIETTRRLRRAVGDDTMIIIISAHDWSDIEQQARQAGADCFISKPLMRANVYDTISRVQSLNPTGSVTQAIRPNRFSGECVLLADDNELNLEIARMLLEFSGLTVECARNGREAAELFESNAPGRFIAILMDIRMPEVDGLEATRRIRAMPRLDAVTIPILAMTANAFEEDKRAALEAGMNGYMVKPLDIKALLHELDKYKVC